MCTEGVPKQAAGRGSLAQDISRTQVLLPLGVVITTFLAYSATLALGFVFDDQSLILSNDSIHSWHYFQSYFTLPLWSFHYPRGMWNAYRPALLVWLRLNDAVYGSHAWGWHFSSALLHVVVTYLVYRLGERLTRSTRIAALGALIFGLHPVHAETIAQVSWADQPLSTLFMLACLLTWWRSRAGGRSRFRWVVASLVLCGLALLSKESSLMLPVLIGACAWIYDGPSGRGSPTRALERARSALTASLPYGAVILAYLPLRVWVLKGFSHVLTPLPLSHEVFTLPSVLLFYLRLLFWPSALSCYYDTPYVSIPGWHGVFLPVALLTGGVLGFFYCCYRTRRREPEQARAIGFAGLWMVLTLIPVLDFRLLPQGEIAHDRYLYLPSVGFVMLVAIALRQVYTRVTGWVKPAGALAALLVLASAMAVATARQCLYWSDDLVLSARSHAIAPHNFSATTSLAAALGARGMDAKAAALYQQALSLQPRFWVANRNLGYLFFNRADYAQAARYLTISLQSGPEEGDQFMVLGLSLLRLGRLDEAEKALRAALQLNPRGKAYHWGLGMVLCQEGRFPEARMEFTAELAANPDSEQAKVMLEEIGRQMQSPGSRPSQDRAQKSPPIRIK